MKLTFTVDGDNQTIIRTDGNAPVADSVKFLTAEFTITGMSGLTCTPLFKIGANSEVKPPEYTQTGTDSITVTCEVPAEVIAYPGFEVSLFGKDPTSDKRITVNTVPVLVTKSGYGNAMDALTPSTTVYEQLLTEIQSGMLKGENGESAYQIAVSLGYTGTEAEWIASFKGQQGEQGVQGIQGLQGIQGVQGEPFRIVKTYASVAAMNADFTGTDVKEGQFVLINTGNVQDEDNAKLYVKGSTAYSFITDLSGAAGIQGEQGSQGQQGIQGIQGLQGDKGTDGAAATIKVGTVTQGTSAAVSNSGTDSAAVFDFTIPVQDISTCMKKGVDNVTAGQLSGSTLGTAATAEGTSNTSSGQYSHAEGSKNTASAYASHVEGTRNTSSKDTSHSEGADTTASGVCAHAEGSGTVASAYCSHAQNGYTIASASYQTALGKYNVSDTSSALIIGNGSADTTDANGNTVSHRSNAATIDFYGNANFIGSGTFSFLKSMRFSTGTIITGSFVSTIASIVADTANEIIPFKCADLSTISDCPNDLKSDGAAIGFIVPYGAGSNIIAWITMITYKGRVRSAYVNSSASAISWADPVNGITVTSTGNFTYTLVANQMVIFNGAVTTLTINLPATYNPWDEFNFCFTTDSTGGNLALPATVSWLGGTTPTLSASKYYECSIVNNKAVIAP